MRGKIGCGGGVRPQADVRWGIKYFKKVISCVFYWNIGYIINNFSLIHYKLLNK